MTDAPGLLERSRRAARAEVARVGVALFLERGFDATTMDDVAAAAGVSRRTLFRYFGSKEEVALGHLTQRELDLVCSAFGGLVAWFRKGSEGTAFVRAVARLGLSKWHTARAVRGQSKTFSMDFILPLRAKIRELRDQGASPA